MTDWRDLKFQPPTKAPPSQQVDYAEFTALRAIVMAMLAGQAAAYSKLTGESAQSWINEVSVLCQQSIINAEITTDGNISEARLRAKVLEKIDGILSAIKVNINSDKSNADA